MNASIPREEHDHTLDSLTLEETVGVVAGRVRDIQQNMAAMNQLLQELRISITGASDDESLEG